MDEAPLSAEDRAALLRQARLGWLAFPIVGPGAVLYMRCLRGHRIVGMPAARRTYREALARGRPTLVCANHLTMYDSIYLHHGLAPLTDYFFDFRRFAWNLPAVENFTSSLFLRSLVFLSKCIPIDRKGDAAHHERVLAQVRHVVREGHVCTIFPEGGRSRTGRVEPDNVTYGIGHILRALERPQVLCAYLRGERQRTWGEVPAWGDTLHLSVQLMEPTTGHTGLRAARDLARQVIGTIKALEDAHFSRMMAKP
ncbi:MAG: 1-acyl-sn-glycerol-3-phosphate acyltransferase [Deltaproteobacteria bacterium]|nr:1-acyl-sn-glycerol-3-phosphate acyltransferase [Deltaproteobacteria bacterium]